MATDSDWVDDVRRWCLSQPRPMSTPTTQSSHVDAEELGYEAANPPVQAPHWPDTQMFRVQAPSP